MKTLLATVAIAFSFAAPADTHEHFEHLPPGGRKSLHGMVLFGEGPYFLEHIPTFSPPHDFQIVTEVELKDAAGAPVSVDFSREGYTLKPSATFSLNDFVAGRLKSFSGSVHRGSFELGAKEVPGLENVSVEVKAYRLIRQLPAESAQSAIRLSDGKNVFETQLIRPGREVQEVRNATAGIVLWCVKGPDFFEPCSN